MNQRTLFKGEYFVLTNLLSSIPSSICDVIYVSKHRFQSVPCVGPVVYNPRHFFQRPIKEFKLLKSSATADKFRDFQLQVNLTFIF